MKKEYEAPEIEMISFCLDDVLSDVLHSSFEKGGQNNGWQFSDDDDDDFSDLGW